MGRLKLRPYYSSVSFARPELMGAGNADVPSQYDRDRLVTETAEFLYFINKIM
jgi:hypothetical protein